jgi:hypothetical protein
MLEERPEKGGMVTLLGGHADFSPALLLDRVSDGKPGHATRDHATQSMRGMLAVEKAKRRPQYRDRRLTFSGALERSRTSIRG